MSDEIRTNPPAETDLERQLEDAIAEVQMNGSTSLLEQLVAAGKLYVHRHDQAPSKVETVRMLEPPVKKLYVTFKDPAIRGGDGEKLISMEKLSNRLSVQE